MQDIFRVTKAMACNINEARDKIRAAFELRETDKLHADWLYAMAKAHIEFNTQGHSIATSKVAEAMRSGSELTPGMKAAYDGIHADMMRDQAEVQAMIATYTQK